MRNIYPLNSRFTLPFAFVLAVSLLVVSLMFMLPGGALHAQTSDDTIEYPENGTSPVATFTAMDPEQTAIVSWTLAGDDAGIFDIAGGVLTFKESPDFEDADTDNMHSVTVQATDSTMKMGTKAVTVEVTNVDEPGTVMLSALRPQSATVFTATLTDPDSVDANDNPTGLLEEVGVTWQWAKAGSRSGTYSDIEDAASDMYTPDDTDTGSYLRATASYTDGEGSGKSAMARSDNAVQRVRGSNNPPVFPDQDPDTENDQSDTAMREVPENTPAGMAIGNPVAATDTDGDILTYTLEGTDADSFDINRATGQIMTKAALDKETDSSYTVTVRATDPAGDPQASSAVADNSDTIMVTITVTDVNEPPAITGDAEVPFAENGTITDALHTYREDNPEDDVASTWSLSGADAGKFDISNVNPIGELTFKAQPDFEMPGDANRDNTYEVTVAATDSDGNRSTMDVKVMVTNVDEDGTVTLSRTQPRVGVAVRATLSDPDRNISGLTWQWTDGRDDIEDATSDTYTPTEADATANVTLSAVATYNDGHVPDPPASKTATGTATNMVERDTRNSPPVFEDQDPETDGDQNQSATRMVEENTKALADDDDAANTDASADNVGGAVTATDLDPNADPLIYTLSGADAGLFRVRDNGQIEVGAGTELDYETKTSYMVTLTAEDSFGDSDSIAVTIMVTDMDEEPVIAGDDTIEYAENGTSPVATYTAMDPEQTAIVSWSLDGTDAGDFTISSTGVLTFKESPDYEMPADSGMDRMYSVTVQATDSTNKVGMKTVMVEVTNVDEPGTVTLSALRPQSATMFTATLTDPDGSISGTTWQWSKATSRNGSYRDIEDAIASSYEPGDPDIGSYLRATASYTDGEGPGKSAMARSDNKAQGVRGLNNPPVFPDQDPDTENDQSDTAMREVPENTPAGMAIGNPVAATDTDGDILTYTLEGTDADSFDINRATGQIMTKAALDKETDSSYTVTVRATDPAGDPQASSAVADNSDTIMVTITVTDVNEPPAITGDAAVMFEEVAGAIATPLHTYDATDPENDTPIVWSLSGVDAGKFDISDTGALTFKAKPDFEASGDANGDNVYEVTVVVADSNGNRDTMDVKVTVANENEDGTVTLSRARLRVGVAVTATLTDPDESISGLRWQWYRSTTINSGDIETTTNLPTNECENDTSDNCVIEGAMSDTYTPTRGDARADDNIPDNGFTLTAVATYTDGQDEMQGTAGEAANMVAVDTRNRPPAFDDQDTEVDGIQNTMAERSVEENTEANATDDADEDGPADNVGSAVMAEDPDPNADALIYTLSGADAGLFRVRDNGQIEVGAGTELDYETRNSYMVTLTAEDSFGATASIPVTIRVNDVDEVPLITGSLPEALGISGRNSVQYPENGTASVETYMATGLNAASARWSVEGDDADDFRVSSAGVLAFRSSPDYEMPADTNTDNVYMITVKATSGSETAIHDVTITVTDEVLSISGRNNIEYVENLTDSVEIYAVAGSMVTWSLEGDDADDFTISSAGVLAFRNSPDYEMPADTNTDNVYMITVKASGGEETAARDVEVTVTDEVLVISGLADIDYEENGAASVGTFVAEGPNAASATWSLEGADADDFAISSSAGVLTFMSSPDYDMPADADEDNVYMITVMATSGTETDTHDVSITVTDVNEETSVFDPLEKYDTNTDNELDKDEVIAAINDYLFGDGSVTKDQIIQVINLYLFGE